MTLTPAQVGYDIDKNGKLEGAEMANYTQAIIDGAISGSSTNAKSSVETSIKKTKLTPQTALAFMQSAAQDAGYTAQFSKEDVTQFINDFNTEQGKQIEKVVTSTAQKITPGGTTQGAVDKTISTTAREEYPSLFKPADFASDWVWNKVNFKDEKGLGSKSLTALGAVRGLVKSFELLSVTDNDIRAAAKQIAMGKKTLNTYQLELQQIAKKEYPQFADRFSADPTLTTYDIAAPVINLLAKTWEVDAKDIKMDDPIVMSYMNYAGPDGKGQPPSRYDLILKAKADKTKYPYTEEANNNARDAAVGLARAFGFGV